MSTSPNPDVLVMQRHYRAFSQQGGSRPDNKIRYAGPDEQSIMFGDVSNPRRGGITAIREHSWYSRGSYQLMGRGQAPPDLATSTLTFRRRHGGPSWLADDLSCPNTFYELVGECAYPDNFLYGWSDYVGIYSNGLASTTTHAGRKSFDTDDPSTDAVDFSWASYYEIGALSFGENAQVPVEREIVDLTYVGGVECANCGYKNDGTQRLYALTKSSGSGSPGIPSEIIWTINGGRNYSQTNITGLGGTVDPTGIDVFGNFLVVIDTTGNGLWVAELNVYTGAPGSWANVTNGFVTNNQPNDMFVANGGLAFLCGQLGTIYQLEDALSGAEQIYNGAGADLRRIAGDGNGTIVAVGESGAAVVSLNDGATWALIDTPTSNTLTAVEVMDRFTYWIGSGDGDVWFTTDGGETWYSVTLGGDVERIDDIRFATNEVGYILVGAPTTTAVRLYTTYNAGRSWSSTQVVGNPRLVNFPTMTRGNRLAVPTLVTDSIAARRVAVGGLNGNAVDGILVQGVQRVIGRK
jgi:photosystem II stability/assembly factor-like uncharacterized protein